VGQIDQDSRKFAVLREAFGFAAFRAGQEPIVDALIDGRNVLAIMPTGAGKSLCYQLPALVRGGLAIVVSPLIALMDDQVAALKLAGLAAEAIHSGKTREVNVAIWRRVVRGAVRLLYLSPERLMAPRMLAALRRLPVCLIAIDEAHCISQWGHSFRADYLGLGALREAFPDVPLAAVTATADRATRDEICDRLFGGAVETIVCGFDRPNIRLTVLAKSNAQRQIERLVRERPGESGIIYRISRRKVEETAAALQGLGVRALPYHAGMSVAERAANQETFLAEAGVVMVATVAFGMGIDKSNVRYVIHGDVPGSLEAYYQEIGRAGRDGAPSDAVMLYGREDVRTRRRFIDEQDCDEERKRIEALRLEALVGFCETTSCRRQVLLGYFGEASGPCGNCDICLVPPQFVDATPAARLAIDMVRTTGERYGAAYLADLLTGEASETVIGRGHDRLPLFGAGADRRRSEWQTILRQLVADGYLAVEPGGYGSLSLADRAAGLIDGTETFRLRLEPPKPGGRRARRRATPAPPAPDAELVARLKSLRRDLAAARNVPAYVVFTDRTLEEMAASRPRSLDELAGVRGVGTAKLAAFGPAFLSVLNER